VRPLTPLILSSTDSGLCARSTVRPPSSPEVASGSRSSIWTTPNRQACVRVEPRQERPVAESLFCGIEQAVSIDQDVVNLAVVTEHLAMGIDDNFLDVPSSKRDGYIYRIVKTNRLFEFLKTGENVLVKPELRDDPFENFILKSHFIRDGEPVVIGPRDHFYGQRWTLQQASDAMWRIYSPRSNAVRIRTHVRKLAGGGCYSHPN
jgi:hypothetical protein